MPHNGYRDPFPGGKAAGANRTPQEECVKLYIHSPTRHHDVVLNYAQEQLYLYHHIQAMFC